MAAKRHSKIITFELFEAKTRVIPLFHMIFYDKVVDAVIFIVLGILHTK